MTEKSDPLLLEALENERRYVARELHDGAAQTTLQLGLLISICRKLLERGDLEKLANELALLEERILLTSTQMREMISDMRPPPVEPGAGLAEYLQQAIETHTQRGGPPVAYQAHLAGPHPELSLLQTLTLIRIVQEALLNIRKHANAQQARLTLSEDSDHFQVVIADDGQSFDPAQVAAQPVDKGGAGLANVRLRAQAMAGSLTIGRDPTGRWTEVTLTLPK